MQAELNSRNQNASNSTHQLLKRASNSQPPLHETGKKSRTTQPNKLAEIFKSVDERNSTQVVVPSQMGNYVPAGMMSTQNVMRALTLNSSGS